VYDFSTPACTFHKVNLKPVSPDPNKWNESCRDGGADPSIRSHKKVKDLGPSQAQVSGWTPMLPSHLVDHVYGAEIWGGKNTFFKTLLHDINLEF
jgi:hypothetical protein